MSAGNKDEESTLEVLAEWADKTLGPMYMANECAYVLVSYSLAKPGLVVRALADTNLPGASLLATERAVEILRGGPIDILPPPPPRGTVH